MLPPRKRRKLKNAILARLTTLLGPTVLRLLGSTWRVKKVGPTRYFTGPGRAPEAGANVILVFWHDSQLLFAYTHRSQGSRVLISRHSDGELIARVVEGVGFNPVRGSSTAGGAAALREMVRVAREGFDFGISPDGPRGPRHEAKGGVITLARLTGLPIVPIAWAADSCWELHSWDRFRIPKPFTRVVVIANDPMEVPRRISPEEERRYVGLLEATMRRHAEEAARLLDPASAGEPVGPPA